MGLMKQMQLEEAEREMADSEAEEILMDILLEEAEREIFGEDD
jgi:hypothetical protein